MTEPSPLRSMALLGLLAVAAAPALPAEVGHRCAAVTSDQARLDCYDAAFGKPAAASDSPDDAAAELTGPTAAVAARDTAAAKPAAVPAAQDAGAKAREEFGLSDIEKRARQPAQDFEPDRITDRIVKLGYRPTGELVVYFGDGQTWTAIETNSRSRVKVGDRVTIRKATLGSYLLVGPDRIGVRVRRLK